MEITTKENIELHCEQSLQSALNATQYTTWERNCTEVTDLDFVNAGILRCLMIADSGRHFLQTSEELGEKMTHSNYYVNLKSRRRTDMLKAVEEQSYKINCSKIQELGIDYLEQFNELKDYTVEAADGHFMDHACHTKASNNGVTYAAGLVYTLNLRLGLLRPCCVITDGSKRSSEIVAFKKKVGQLNKSEKVGLKHLYVYDKAVIDYHWWHNQKKFNNYVTTLLRKKSVFNVERDIVYDSEDEVNIGVEKYYLCSKGDYTFTLIEYRDPETGSLLKFVSTLPPTVRPGVISNIYHKRWTIEKSFNNSKSNLKEKKAWSPNKRSMSNQMCFTAMTYNLLRIFEEASKSNEPEMIHPSDNKYTKELNRRQKKAQKVGRFVNPLLFKKRITRISSFTIRAVQLAIYTGTSLVALIDKLRNRLIELST